MCLYFYKQNANLKKPAMYKIERFHWNSRVNEWFILIYKRLNDNVHFCTLSRVNINHQTKRKTPLYLHREIKPSAVRGIRCSAAASLPFFMITITDAPHVSHVPLRRCLKPLCASYLESVLENVGRNRVKSAQALRKRFLRRLLTRIWHTAYVQCPCCRRCILYTAIWNHCCLWPYRILYDATY